MKMEMAEKDPGAESKDGEQEELRRPGEEMVLTAACFDILNQNSLFRTRNTNWWLFSITNSSLLHQLTRKVTQGVLAVVI